MKQNNNWQILVSLRWASQRTKSFELGKEVYARLLAVLSDDTDRFLHQKDDQEGKDTRKKNKLSLVEEQTLIKHIKINREKLPKRFIEVFELQVDDTQLVNNALTLFQNFEFLIKDAYWNNISRVITVDGNILIFREEFSVTHQNNASSLTQAEKRRKEKTVRFNTFNSIYDAIRSQYHTIESEAKNADDYGLYQQEVLDLMEEIERIGKDSIKDMSFQKRISELVEETKNAKNYQILAMNLHNLKDIVFNNCSIVKNKLLWANNKLEKRFEEVWKIIAHVSDQLKSLEQIKDKHEEILSRFFIQYTDNDPKVMERYEKDYQYLPRVTPFSTLHSIIQKALHMEEWKPFIEEAYQIFNDIRDEYNGKINFFQ